MCLLKKSSNIEWRIFSKLSQNESLTLHLWSKHQSFQRQKSTPSSQKKWKYANGKLLTTEGKEVAHQGMLFDILSQCDHRIAHRGRQKTEKWIAENYSEVTEKVVNTFVSLCRFHGEQKPITTRVKPMVQMEVFFKLKHSFPWLKLILWILEIAHVNVNQSTSGLLILLITTQSLLMFTPSITNLLMNYWMKFKSIV